MEITPLLGNKYGRNSYFPVDLSCDNPDLGEINSQSDLTAYLDNQRAKLGRAIPYGGYGEKRNLYKSTLFQREKEIRNIHLAIDIWTCEGVELYAPVDGKVLSISYNDKELDYGHTLIIEHHFGPIKFHFLCGHLSSSIFELWNSGDHVNAGDLIGHVGDITENGGWSPHVHCQLIIDLEENIGDYPGVCSEYRKKQYLDNCPDPSNFILPKN